VVRVRGIPFGSEKTIGFVFQRKEGIFVDKEIPELFCGESRVGIN
jgi:hypothetical protein